MNLNLCYSQTGEKNGVEQEQRVSRLHHVLQVGSAGSRVFSQEKVEIPDS